MDARGGLHPQQHECCNPRSEELPGPLENILEQSHAQHGIVRSALGRRVLSQLRVFVTAAKSRNVERCFAATLGGDPQIA